MASNEAGKTNVYTFHHIDKTQRLAVFQGTPALEIESIVRETLNIPGKNGERLVFLDENGDRAVLSSWAPDNCHFFVDAPRFEPYTEVVGGDSRTVSILDVDEKSRMNCVPHKALLRLCVDFIQQLKWSDVHRNGGEILDAETMLMWKGISPNPSYIYSTPFELPSEPNAITYIAVRLQLAFCCEGTGLVAETVTDYPNRAHMYDDPRFRCVIANMAINYARKERLSKVNRQVSYSNSGNDFTLGIAITNAFAIFVDHNAASAPRWIAELPTTCRVKNQRVKLVAGHIKHGGTWVIQKVKTIPSHAVLAVLAEKKRLGENMESAVVGFQAPGKTDE